MADQTGNMVKLGTYHVSPTIRPEVLRRTLEFARVSSLSNREPGWADMHAWGPIGFFWRGWLVTFCDSAGEPLVRDCRVINSFTVSAECVDKYSSPKKLRLFMVVVVEALRMQLHDYTIT